MRSESSSIRATRYGIFVHPPLRDLRHLLCWGQVLFVAVAFGGVARAQEAGPAAASANDAPVIHHVYMAAVAPRDAVAWYAAHLDGTPTRYHYRHAVQFENETMLVFEQVGTEGPTPSALGHLGFFVEDLNEAAERTGARMSDDGQSAAVVDPTGISIRLYGGGADAGLAHVAIVSASAEASLDRLARLLGGSPESLPHVASRTGLRYGPAWVTYTQPGSEAADAAPAIVGWRVGNTDALLQRSRAQEAPVTLGPARFPARTITRVRADEALIVELYEPH